MTLIVGREQVHTLTPCPSVQEPVKTDERALPTADSIAPRHTHRYRHRHRQQTQTCTHLLEFGAEVLDAGEGLALCVHGLELAEARRADSVSECVSE